MMIEETSAAQAASQGAPVANCTGFVGGTIAIPTIGISKLPALGMPNYAGEKGGAFGVFGFALPFKSTIRRASILVDNAQPGHRVFVALYDADRKKVCALSFDVSRGGIVTAEFASAITLEAGDYWLAWAASARGVPLQTIGVNSGQFALANAGGSAVLGVVATAHGTSALPATFCAIRPTTEFTPICVYFKS